MDALDRDRMGTARPVKKPKAKRKEQNRPKTKDSGYGLEYDAARKIAQGLGAHLEACLWWRSRARLLFAFRRGAGQYLFGKDEGEAPAKRKAKARQLSLLEELEGWRKQVDGVRRVPPELANRSGPRPSGHDPLRSWTGGSAESLLRNDGASDDHRFWHLGEALCTLTLPERTRGAGWRGRDGEKERAGVLKWASHCNWSQRSIGGAVQCNSSGWSPGSAFHCFRCDQDKKAKLLTVYNGDWDRLLCNGCYGSLLSIYEIKKGTDLEEEKAEALGRVLLSLASEEEIRRSTERILISESRTSLLSPPAMKYLATADHVANGLDAGPDLDWSPAVIGSAKPSKWSWSDYSLNRSDSLLPTAT